MTRILSILALLLCCAQDAGAVELFSRYTYYHCGKPYYGYRAYHAPAAVVPSYNTNSVSYTYNVSYSQPAAHQGNTQYGVSDIASFYGDIDFGAAFNQAARLADSAQQLSAKATAGYSDLLTTTSADRTRVAEILAKGQAAAQTLSAVKAGNSVTIQRTNEAHAQVETAAPQALPNLGTTEAKCARCHNAQTAEQLGNGNVLPSFSQFTAEQARAGFRYITRLDESNCAKKAQLSEDEQQSLARFFCSLAK